MRCARMSPNFDMKRSFSVASSAADLSDRERLVLRLVVRNYVATANPVGSEFLVRSGHLAWSSATIRNTFARLEDKGFVEHPHTSAGRMPTERGYRYFVKSLHAVQVEERDASAVQAMPFSDGDAENVLRGVAHLLGRISGQLSLIAASYTQTGVLHKLELLPLSSTRVLVVLAVTSGAVRSVVLEIPVEFPAALLERVASQLNERLHGKTLAEVRSYCDTHARRADGPEAAVIRLIRLAPRLFDAPDAQRVVVSGAPNVLRHPEFQRADRLQPIMELIDDEGSVSDVLRDLSVEPDRGVSVTIGAEHADPRLHGCSTIAAEFHWGDVAGRLSVLGPTRLEYERLTPLVAYVARTLSSSSASRS